MKLPENDLSLNEIIPLAENDFNKKMNNELFENITKSVKKVNLLVLFIKISALFTIYIEVFYISCIINSCLHKQRESS